MGDRKDAILVPLGISIDGSGVSDDGLVILDSTTVAEVDCGAEARPVGSPWAASAFITTSQPLSRVRIRSFSSSFSRFRARSC